MNKMKKWLVTVVAVIVLALGVVAISSNFTSKGLGEIQVELVDLEGNTESKTIVFNEGDTLVSLIEEN